MNVLITGAAGFVGKNLAAALRNIKDGKDKTHPELTINEIDNNKVVTDIFVLDDTVSIPQGLKIGDSQDKIPQLMGDNYTKDGNAYNFVDGNTLLQIMVSDGAIKSIEYKPAN